MGKPKCRGRKWFCCGCPNSMYLKNKKVDPEDEERAKRVQQECKRNPARSDFKVYQLGRDDGRIPLESQRRSAAAERIMKDKKWKPK